MTLEYMQASDRVLADQQLIVSSFCMEPEDSMLDAETVL